MVIELSDTEIRVLDELVKRQGRMLSLDELAGELGVERSTVASAVEALSGYGLVEKRSVTRHLAELTARGQAMVRLPEDVVFELVSAVGELPLEEARRRSALGEEDFRAAVAWGVKRGLFRLSRGGDGVTRIVKGSDERSLSEFFRSLRAAGRLEVEPASREIGILRERGIATLRSVGEIYVGVMKGVDASQLKVRRRVTALTHRDLVSGAYRDLVLPEYTFGHTSQHVVRGKKHFYLEFLEMVKEVLVSLGFEEMYGPYVEREFWNFDALFVPQDHVARESHDSYRVSGFVRLGDTLPEGFVDAVGRTHRDGWVTGSAGWGGVWDMGVAARMILRSHTTAVSVRRLAEHHAGGFKYFTVDHNFRRDAVDATHLPDFHQCEGIVGGEGLTLKHLFGFLETFSRRLGVEKIRFKPGYFPFTEPSVEAYVYHEKLGWIEAAPGGVFRPEVTKPLGVEHPVLAWGIGITRFAMIYYGLDDIRQIVTRDLSEILDKEEAEVKFGHY
ncbi:MAG: phenylalanine--tRNA ligase subunit alpha [Thermoprotei archaeon]